MRTASSARSQDRGCCLPPFSKRSRALDVAADAVRCPRHACGSMESRYLGRPALSSGLGSPLVGDVW